MKVTESIVKKLKTTISDYIQKMKMAEVKCASYHEIQERIRSNRMHYERNNFPYNF